MCRASPSASIPVFALEKNVLSSESSIRFHAAAHRTSAHRQSRGRGRWAVGGEVCSAVEASFSPASRMADAPGEDPAEAPTGEAGPSEPAGPAAEAAPADAVSFR